MEELSKPVSEFIAQFLQERWPTLAKDPAMIAFAVGALIGAGVMWLIYWAVNKSKINARDATIAGLDGEKNILERQKEELSGEVGKLKGEVAAASTMQLSINRAVVDEGPPSPQEVQIRQRLKSLFFTTADHTTHELLGVVQNITFGRLKPGPVESCEVQIVFLVQAHFIEEISLVLNTLVHAFDEPRNSTSDLVHFFGAFMAHYERMRQFVFSEMRRTKLVRDVEFRKWQDADAKFYYALETIIADSNFEELKNRLNRVMVEAEDTKKKLATLP